jgi:hypothetical protein
VTEAVEEGPTLNEYMMSHGRGGVSPHALCSVADIDIRFVILATPSLVRRYSDTTLVLYLLRAQVIDHLTTKGIPYHLAGPRAHILPPRFPRGLLHCGFLHNTRFYTFSLSISDLRFLSPSALTAIRSIA